MIAQFPWRPAYHKMQPVISMLCFIHSVLHFDLYSVPYLLDIKCFNRFVSCSMTSDSFVSKPCYLAFCFCVLSLTCRSHRVLNRAASVPESSDFFTSSSLSGQFTLAQNVTVIEVSNDQHSPHSAVAFDCPQVFNFNLVEDTLPALPDNMPVSNSTGHENLDFREDVEFNETVYTPPVTTENQCQMPAGVTSTNGSLSIDQIEVTDSGGSYYECVFLPNAAQSPWSVGSSVSNTDHATARNVPRNDVLEVMPSPIEMTSSVRSVQSRNDTSVQRLSGSADGPFNDIQQRRARRSSSASDAALSSSPSSGASHARVTALASAERNRVVAQRTDVERRLQPAPHPYRQALVCVVSLYNCYYILANSVYP